MKNDNLIKNMNNDEVQKHIDNYLDVRKEEKERFGEVFTPTSLIEESA